MGKSLDGKRIIIKIHLERNRIRLCDSCAIEKAVGIQSVVEVHFIPALKE